MKIHCFQNVRKPGKAVESGAVAFYLRLHRIYPDEVFRDFVHYFDMHMNNFTIPWAGYNSTKNLIELYEHMESKCEFIRTDEDEKGTRLLVKLIKTSKKIRIIVWRLQGSYSYLQQEDQLQFFQ